MSPRTGRPPSENPKADRITVRLNGYEAKELEECANALRTSKAEVICRGLELMGVERKSIEAKKLFEEIIGLFCIDEIKDTYDEDEYNKLISMSIRQIDDCYGEFMKSVKK